MFQNQKNRKKMVSSFGRAADVQSYPCDFIEVKTFWIRKHTACNEQGTCTTTSVHGHLFRFLFE